jgi:hypothetical protein
MTRILKSTWVASIIVVLMVTTGWPRPSNRQASLKFDTVPKSDGRGVEVRPLDEGALHRLQEAAPSMAALAKILVVYADTDDATGLPIPMLGTYQIGGGSIRFTPRFPWVPGLTYRAKFDHRLFINRYGYKQWDRSREESYLHLSFSVQREPGLPTTVTKVYPSSDHLPENLLRVYIHFSSPMSFGNAYCYIHLLDESGAEVARPFLVLDQELWDRGHQRLTLLFDPSRIKRGIKANIEQGPPLKTGRKHKLVIDAAWPDRTGSPLASSFHKVFTVIPADRKSPEYEKWRVLAPLARTTEPVRLLLGKSLDAALLGRMITVCDATGKPVEGRIEIAAEETEWRFIPTFLWQPGRFEIRVNPALEDLAGNNLARVFDTDLSELGLAKQLPDFVMLPFIVKQTGQ